MWQIPRGGKFDQDQPPGSLSTGLSRHIRKRNDLLFKQSQGGMKRLREFYAQARTLFLVPCSGFNRLARCFFEDSYSSHYRWPSRSLNRRSSSLRSISFAVPESMARKHRRISSSHSVSALASAGSSRLFTRSYARAARSVSESARADILLLLVRSLYSTAFDTGQT